MGRSGRSGGSSRPAVSKVIVTGTCVPGSEGVQEHRKGILEEEESDWQQRAHTVKISYSAIFHILALFLVFITFKEALTALCAQNHTKSHRLVQHRHQPDRLLLPLLVRLLLLQHQCSNRHPNNLVASFRVWARQ
jgi:hypothetical protein